MNMIIQPTLDYDDMETLDVYKITQNENLEKYEFIQQVLHKINMMSGQFSQVNATLWLVKGDHFFFYCDLLLTQD